jgi:RNA-directed DNA polymerase
MKGRRLVTGIILTTDGKLSLGRGKKRQLRSLVFNYPSLSKPERLTLRGWLAYCRSIEPDFLNSLVIKFGAERFWINICAKDGLLGQLCRHLLAKRHF